MGIGSVKRNVGILSLGFRDVVGLGRILLAVSSPQPHCLPKLDTTRHSSFTGCSYPEPDIRSA